MHDSCEADGVSLDPQVPTPFNLIPDGAQFQLTHSTPLVSNARIPLFYSLYGQRIMIQKGEIYRLRLVVAR